ncbi:unnamed protein product [Discosporangium mesarthrocarpum]
MRWYRPLSFTCGLLALWRSWSFAWELFWFSLGVISWGYAFTVQGRLVPRKPVCDNVRLARFVSSAAAVAYVGAAFVGALEALVSYMLLDVWHVVVLNVVISALSFSAGSAIFRSFQDWVVLDPSLDSPLPVLTLCVVS